MDFKCLGIGIVLKEGIHTGRQKFVKTIKWSKSTPQASVSSIWMMKVRSWKDKLWWMSTPFQSQRKTPTFQEPYHAFYWYQKDYVTLTVNHYHGEALPFRLLRTMPSPPPHLQERDELRPLMPLVLHSLPQPMRVQEDKRGNILTVFVEEVVDSSPLPPPTTNSSFTQKSKNILD